MAPTVSKDIVLNFAQQLGLRVTHVPPPSVDWTNAFVTFILRLPLYFALAFAYLLTIRLTSGTLRKVLALLIYAVQFFEPFFAVSSGVDLINFLLPAISFFVFFHVIDLFFIRSEDLVNSWSARRILMELFCFPDEETSFNNPNKRTWSIIGKGIYNIIYFAITRSFIVNILLYFIPSREIFSTIKPYSLPWFLAHVAPSLSILCLLEGIMGCGVQLIALLGQVEMKPTFNNPLGSRNIREFWAAWNLAIKDGLARVIFPLYKLWIGESQSQSQPSKSRKPPTILHTDTEISESDAPETPAFIKKDLSARKAFTSFTPATSKNNTDLHQRHKKGSEIPTSASSSPPSSSSSSNFSSQQSKAYKRKRYLFQTLSGYLTFFISGAFHEYMNQAAYQGADGFSIIFFLVHATACAFYTWLRRSAPGFLKHIPNWLGTIMVIIFNILTSPLFMRAFLRANFFETLKSVGYFGPVTGYIWLFSDGY